MSSSFSIEISRDDFPQRGASRSSKQSSRRNNSSSVSHEFDVTPSEPFYPESGRAGQRGRWQPMARGEAQTPGGSENEASVSSAPASASPSAGPSGCSVDATQQQQQKLKQQQHRQRQLQQPEGEGVCYLNQSRSEVDDVQSSFVSGEAYDRSCQPEQPVNTNDEAPWENMQLAPLAIEGSVASGGGASRALGSAGRASPAGAAAGSSALLRHASTTGGRGPTRQRSGRKQEGILKRPTEKWTLAQSSVGEDVVIGQRGTKLWLAPGSVLWRFFLCALALRIGSSLALLVIVLTTLERMGRAVSCVDMSKCGGGGGILAFPILLRALPNFGIGVTAYESITGSLVAGLVLMLLPMAGNCYFTCQALLKGTRKAYLDEVKVTTCCTAWVGACVGVFIPVVFLTYQFCDLERFDVNGSLRPDSASIGAASINMCNQLGLSCACLGVAILCACSTGLLVFQRYSRLWAAQLGLGCVKFMLAGYLLCSTIMLGGQSNQMMLETMDTAVHTGGLQSAMIVQMGLFFAALKWGGYILAVSNMASGAFTVWMAHLRSHLLSCTNMLINFVFFFTNAVSFFAMTFEFATLNVVCDYPTYPMQQTERAAAEAAFFCTIRPHFIFLWLLVALLSVVRLAELLVSALLFHREFCSAKIPKPGALPSAPSIDSLPPKWGSRNK
ncbi:hypothetical protein, conserved [Eimeria tenella]|uniref:Uncharacterized protein n=1 Tax=Eimeria tenella TaxID=5802 RepID=U6KTG1_EIMTE|nr:hypothetical protein, conserved [Eimeria tenella]CDJ41251.1 hypothetical protein, conserved [Eimeria tenella]|eukprot:XP_013232001.1 hypothetical protein, conserved [Eimeria tenella]